MLLKVTINTLLIYVICIYTMKNPREMTIYFMSKLRITNYTYIIIDVAPVGT